MPRMTPAERAEQKRINAERAKRIAAAQEAARKVVATGCCPDCGGKLRRNLSLTGWWQCEQYGAVGFRARPADPSCSWQAFTE
jgi:hypothetical protein